MKKISKLVINPEKVMTDGELKTLRGGDDYYHCLVMCFMDWPETGQTPYSWDGIAISADDAIYRSEDYWEATHFLPSGFCDAQYCTNGGAY